MPSRTGKKAGCGFSETMNLLQCLFRTQARQVSRTVLDPGCTVYLTYLFLYSVWTDVQSGTVCPMYSCERTVEEGLRTVQMRRSDQNLALGCRRGEEFSCSS